MSQEEDIIEYLYSIIDESMVKEIEDTTLSYYKDIFELSNRINSYQSQIEEIENDVLQNKNGINIEKSRIEINSIKTFIKDNKMKLNLSFEKLVKYSYKNNFFFCYSTLKTYKFYYEAFYLNFKRIMRDDNLLSFLKFEYEYHYNFQKDNFLIKNENRTNFIHRTLLNDHFSYIDFYNHLFETNKMKIKLENEKILKYLKEEINKHGFQIVKKSVDDKFELISQSAENFNPEPEIDKKGLPKINVQTRYHLFKSLGYEDAIFKLNCDNQVAKHKLLAILLNISIDNARHLLNGTYKYVFSIKDEENIKKYLSEQGIDKQFLIE